MDSLLANYASSDEEAEEQQQKQEAKQQQKGLSLPKPTSNSTSIASDSASKTPFFSSLPQPKSSIFSSLPPPTSKSQTLTDPPSSHPKPKRVVQFRPPIPQSVLKSRDEEEDDEDEERERKRRNQSVTQTPSVSSWLSAIPAPKHSQATLGAIPSSGNSESNRADGSSGTYQTVENFECNWVDGSSSASLEQSSNWSGGAESQQVYEGYGSYGNYGGYGHYENNWGDGSAAALPEVAGTESAVRVPGKRGRTEVPVEIVEVKQDELIKNRPREDQVKLTGIAFGPSYQFRGACWQHMFPFLELIPRFIGWNFNGKSSQISLEFGVASLEIYWNMFTS
ncbi:hypothetical protein CK203_074314 [Vitis vinifera]|uniref:Uncharacterized protein n=1 Tax=Vitis vinifera TaxID=29760 RepID=A0A438BZ06_VITVI|nr:hypothetical protein CK203_074314 [Vitis vinifera]